MTNHRQSTIRSRRSGCTQTPLSLPHVLFFFGNQLLHDLGDHRILLLQLLLKLDLTPLGSLRGPFAGSLEGRRTVLKELLLPAVELGWIQIVRITDIRYHSAFNKVLSQDRFLLLGGVFSSASFGHRFLPELLLAHIEENSNSD